MADKDFFSNRLQQRRRNEMQLSVMRRTAKEVRRYRVNIRLLSFLLAMLVVLTAAVYLVAVLYRKSGSFSVAIDKYEMTKYGISLSESRDLTHLQSHLDARINEEMTNITGSDIAENVDMIDGEHNGRDYIAYTFYLQNAGEYEVTYDYQVIMSNVTNGLDEAIRLRLYVDGEPTTYAKTRSDGLGAEPGTEEFYANNVMVHKRIENLAPGGVTKYTLVLWLEGNDPDCIDWLIGGTIKVEMQMSVVH
jgi:hypothetical protein